jgi:replicative DNA helicase
MRHIKGLIAEKIEKIEQACFVRPASLTTPFHMLDNHTGELAPGELIVVGGRPGMGVTTLLLNIATGVAKENPDKSVVIFSSEQQDLITAKILAAESSITTDQQREGCLNECDWDLMNHSAEKLANSGLLIDDSVFMLHELREKLSAIENLSLVVIDHPEILRAFSDDCVCITTELKRIAQEFNVPVIISVRLPQSCERRKNKRPRLVDLTELTTATRYIDTAIFLYRENYYNRRFDNPHLAECIVARSRGGTTGTVYLHFNGTYNRFNTMLMTKETSYE